jgi:hypothetical protein
MPVLPITPTFCPVLMHAPSTTAGVISAMCA